MIDGITFSLSHDSSTQTFSGTVKNTSIAKDSFEIEINLKQGSATIAELGPLPVVNLAPGQSMDVQLLLSDEPGWQNLSFNAWQIHKCSGEGSNEGSGGEGNESSEGGEGSEGSEGSEGGSEGSEGSESGNGSLSFSIDESCSILKSGIQLQLAYDKATQSFTGSALNVSSQIATRVRVEIHLSNSVELGPTTNVDLAPGNQTNIVLPAKGQTFATWTAHAEVGNAEGGEGGSSEGSEGGNEGSEGSEGDSEGGESSNERSEGGD